MADFQQNVVPTFTRLVDEDLGRMEKNILRAARRTPIGVIIPTLFSDLSSPAMQHIIQELAEMSFVKCIYISANEDGGNPASRWGAEIHNDDARRVISHGSKAIGVWGFVLEE